MFFDRAEGGEKAILVHVDFHIRQEGEDRDEFVELCSSAGLDIAFVFSMRMRSPVAKTFIGAGKCEELVTLIQSYHSDVVLFNNTLSPSQQRNLEEILDCRVIDRTGLILDIFAQRARTHEGKLQVELAQLQYVSTRLIRGWTHLERQKGGIGLRGPGETQLETDRRLIRARISSIEKRLDKVKKQREQGRRSRVRAQIPTVAIVGYTNAGKSTLFNQLTQSDVYAADQLFATLDPTLRKISIPGFGPVILADTVGFIRHLPHRLVESFKATLEETVEADLLLHVIDASADERLDNIDQVNSVLTEIGADDKKQLMVYNKIDLLRDIDPRTDKNDEGEIQSVWVSARDRQGFDLLLDAIVVGLGCYMWHGDISLSPSHGALRAILYDGQVIENESFDNEGNQLLTVSIALDEIERLERRLKVDWRSFVVDNEKTPYPESRFSEENGHDNFNSH